MPPERRAKTVCIIGNYSGRNAGDAAMLEGIMLDLRERFGELRFTIPTLNPRFIRSTYRGLGAIPVSILPWNASVKLLGWPAWKAIRDADVVLITDAILFDRSLANPFKNYLSSLAFLLPPARRRGVPIVLYNVNIGPVGTKAGRWCLQRVLTSAVKVAIRDDISRRTLGRLGVFMDEAHAGGDSALGATPASSGEVDGILARHKVAPGSRPVVGFNINAYGDAFLQREHAHMRPRSVIPMLAGVIRWVRAELGADVWIFSTQHMDESLCRQLQQAVGAAESPLFSNRTLSHRAIMGLMSRLSLMVGMRTHSLILASSWGVPVVGMVTYPKTYGYLERIGQQDRCVPISRLTEIGLRRLISETWAGRVKISAEVAEAVERQRELSKHTVEFLAPFLSAPEVLTGTPVPART